VPSVLIFLSQITVGNHIATLTPAGLTHHSVVTGIDRRNGHSRIIVTHHFGNTYNPDLATVRRSELTNAHELIREGLLVRLVYDHFSGRRIVATARYLRHLNPPPPPPLQPLPDELRTRSYLATNRPRKVAAGGPLDIDRVRGFSNYG
jgi:hypothetical protein